MRLISSLTLGALVTAVGASMEYPGLSAQMFNVPYNYEFKFNKKFYALERVLPTEIAESVQNITFKLPGDTDLDYMIEENSGFFVASETGEYQFTLDASIDAYFQIGAGEVCHSEAFKSVATDAVLKSSSKASLPVLLKKGGVYPVRVTQIVPKGSKNENLSFISLSLMDPLGKFVNDISPFVFQGDLGEAVETSPSSVKRKRSLRSCDSISTTKKGFLERIHVINDKTQYDLKNSALEGYTEHGIVTQLDSPAKVYGKVVNSRKFATELRGFIRVNETGTHKFVFDVQGAVSFQIGKQGTSIAAGDPVLQINTNAKKDTKSYKQPLIAGTLYPVRIVYVNKRSKPSLNFKLYHRKSLVDLSDVWFHRDQSASDKDFEETDDEKSYSLKSLHDSSGISSEVSTDLDDDGASSAYSPSSSNKNSAFDGNNSDVSALSDDFVFPDVPREPLLKGPQTVKKIRKSREAGDDTKDKDTSVEEKTGNSVVEEKKEGSDMEEKQANPITDEIKANLHTGENTSGFIIDDKNTGVEIEEKAVKGDSNTAQAVDLVSGKGGFSDTPVHVVVAPLDIDGLQLDDELFSGSDIAPAAPVVVDGSFINAKLASKNRTSPETNEKANSEVQRIPKAVEITPAEGAPEVEGIQKNNEASSSVMEMMMADDPYTGETPLVDPSFSAEVKTLSEYIKESTSTDEKAVSESNGVVSKDAAHVGDNNISEKVSSVEGGSGGLFDEQSKEDGNKNIVSLNTVATTGFSTVGVPHGSSLSLLVDSNTSSSLVPSNIHVNLNALADAKVSLNSGDGGSVVPEKSSLKAPAVEFRKENAHLNSVPFVFSGRLNSSGTSTGSISVLPKFAFKDDMTLSQATEEYKSELNLIMKIKAQVGLEEVIRYLQSSQDPVVVNAFVKMCDSSCEDLAVTKEGNICLMTCYSEQSIKSKLESKAISCGENCVDAYGTKMSTMTKTFTSTIADSLETWKTTQTQTFTSVICDEECKILSSAHSKSDNQVKIDSAKLVANSQEKDRIGQAIHKIEPGIYEAGCGRKSLNSLSAFFCLALAFFF